MRVARLPQDQRALDGAKHVTLLGPPVGGEGGPGEERGDGFRLMLPLSPGRGFRKVRAESLTDPRPVGVAEHVDKIQVGCLNGAAPVAESLTVTGLAGAPLVCARGLGSEDDMVLAHKPLGVGRAQELSRLDGPRLAIFLALPAEPRAP